MTQAGALLRVRQAAEAVTHRLGVQLISAALVLALLVSKLICVLYHPSWCPSPRHHLVAALVVVGLGTGLVAFAWWDRRAGRRRAAGMAPMLDARMSNGAAKVSMAHEKIEMAEELMANAARLRGYGGAGPALAVDQARTAKAMAVIARDVLMNGAAAEMVADADGPD